MDKKTEDIAEFFSELSFEEIQTLCKVFSRPIDTEKEVLERRIKALEGRLDSLVKEDEWTRD